METGTIRTFLKNVAPANVPVTLHVLEPITAIDSRDVARGIEKTLEVVSYLTNSRLWLHLAPGVVKARESSRIRLHLTKITMFAGHSSSDEASEPCRWNWHRSQRDMG